MTESENLQTETQMLDNSSKGENFEKIENNDTPPVVNNGNNNNGVGEEQKSESEKNNQNEDVAPDNYDFKNVEMPEGMNLDEELTTEFSATAKEMNLSQAKADKFMQMGVKLAEKIQNRMLDAYKEQINTYSTMLNTDPEIGGAKLQQSLADANIAYKQFVPDDAAKLLSDTGLNKHPAIVKVFMNIGKQMKNDTIRQTGNVTKERTAADWYPDMKK